MIGIAITTFNRPEIFADTLQRILHFAPPDAPVIVVDDGSAVPAVVPDERVTLYRFHDNQGIATAKNKCLELLCETRATDFFLFDDDTYPTAPDWWLPYVESPWPHLQYQFESAPDHWRLRVEAHVDAHCSFDHSRGCMLYVRRGVLRGVGGMHTAFGKHGAEHEDWSERIHRFGFTRWPFADVDHPDLRCRDQAEAGISSVDCREHQQWRTVDRSTLPSFATFRKPIPVLVPRRADHGLRDMLWEHLRLTYWPFLREPCCEVIEGTHTIGPFNRSAALNAAAHAAGDWELAIIADSDSWVDPLQLRDAVALARRSGRLVVAFDHVLELTQDATSILLRRHGPIRVQPGYSTERVRTEAQDPTTVQSTMLVVPRAVWDAVGGFDERFAGWGCEDNAFWRACELLTGSPLRVPGPAYHLWHPTSKPDRSNLDYQRNLWRWSQYDKAVCAEDVRRLREAASA